MEIESPVDEATALKRYVWCVMRASTVRMPSRLATAAMRA